MNRLLHTGDCVDGNIGSVGIGHVFRCRNYYDSERGASFGKCVFLPQERLENTRLRLHVGIQEQLRMNTLDCGPAKWTETWSSSHSIVHLLLGG